MLSSSSLMAESYLKGAPGRCIITDEITSHVWVPDYSRHYSKVSPQLLWPRAVTQTKLIWASRQWRTCMAPSIWAHRRMRIASCIVSFLRSLTCHWYADQSLVREDWCRLFQIGWWILLPDEDIVKKVMRRATNRNLEWEEEPREPLDMDQVRCPFELSFIRDMHTLMLLSTVLRGSDPFPLSSCAFPDHG